MLLALYNQRRYAVSKDKLVFQRACVFSRGLIGNEFQWKVCLFIGLTDKILLNNLL
jgi:hypothetical protein